MDLQTIKPAIDAYIARLKKEIPVEGVILFGSFAKGKARADSDVDLVILSQEFSEMSDEERLKILYRSSVGFPRDLHAYGLTRGELESASPLTIIGEIKKEGRVIL